MKDNILLYNSYFIIINNPEDIVSSYITNLDVSILNPAAKTILIKFRHRNAAKTSDIVNTIVEEFKEYDIEKKAESAGDEVISAIEKEIEELTLSLQPVEKSRDQQAFLDECAG